MTPGRAGDAPTNAVQDAPPLVSVVMPTHNDEAFIRPAVESILRQSFTDFEFIIVDDGSTDSTPAILAEYAVADPRIRVLTNETNLGIVGALNRGLDAAGGKYIARMDGDDISTPERFARQVEVMEAEPDVIALSGAMRYIDADGEDLGVYRQATPDRSILSASPMLHATCMLRREPMDAHRVRYRERFRCAEDYCLWLELNRCGRLSAIDEVVYLCRMNRGSIRMFHLKKVLARTLAVKLFAVRRLGYRPGPRDLLRFAAECVLMVLPTRLVRSIYLRMMFGKNWRVKM
ncbi:MAG: glycosyltransferase family 2 protein [Phycisphaerae bacterium]